MTLEQYQHGNGIKSISYMPEFLLRRFGKREIQKGNIHRLQAFRHRYRILLEREKQLFNVFSEELREQLVVLQAEVKTIDTELGNTGPLPSFKKDESPTENFQRRKHQRIRSDRRSRRKTVCEELLKLGQRLDERKATYQSRVKILNEKTKLVLETYCSVAGVDWDSNDLLEDFKNEV